MRLAKSDYETNLIQNFATRDTSKIYKGAYHQTKFNTTYCQLWSLPMLPLTMTEHLCSIHTSTQSLTTVLLHYHHLKTCHLLSKRFVTSIFLNLKSTTCWLHLTQPWLWVLLALV